MKYKKGFRLLAWGWTDGNIFLPVYSCLLASSKEHNILGLQEHFDGRSLAAKRRKLAQTKGTDVMLELIEKAKACGMSAGYVLSATWFSAPAQLLAIKDADLDAIAMIKKRSRILYTYEGERLSLKKIYDICKKNRGRSRILLSVNVMVGPDDNQILAKIICVRNKYKKKDWIAFICTNPNLSDEEIVRIYGKDGRLKFSSKSANPS